MGGGHYSSIFVHIFVAFSSSFCSSQPNIHPGKINFCACIPSFHGSLPFVPPFFPNVRGLRQTTPRAVGTRPRRRGRGTSSFHAASTLIRSRTSSAGRVNCRIYRRSSAGSRQGRRHRRQTSHTRTCTDPITHSLRRTPAEGEGPPQDLEGNELVATYIQSSSI